MKQRIIYMVQYNQKEGHKGAHMSAMVIDDKRTIYRFADVQKNNRKNYPVAVWRIKQRQEA